MESQPEEISPETGTEIRAPYIAYVVVMLGVALVCLAVLVLQTGAQAPTDGYRVYLFFLPFALFTIAVGFPHASFGHISFDRVGHVASILVLGPIHAAIIHFIASFIYPWHRLRLGEPPSSVLVASMHNAGLMTLMILASGFTYLGLGGDIPVQTLSFAAIWPLLVLTLSLQFFNDLGMMIVFAMRGRKPTKVFSVFGTSMELMSGLVGVLVAIVFSRMEPTVVALLLTVLGAGMLAIRQFAMMRRHLESTVEARTLELREKSYELERQATRDKLTGLYNRRYADDQVERELQNCRRYGLRLTVALVDIDGFKSINDSHRHAAGDTVLARIGEILTDRCRAGDVIARYGGDEFLLAFPQTRLAAAASLCEELRAAIEHAQWPQIEGLEQVTVSIGLAQLGVEHSLEELLKIADERLYQAKAEGRNRVVDRVAHLQTISNAPDSVSA